MQAQSPDYFTADHFRAHSLGSSAQLAEQAVHCLELVAQLSATGLPYQFKGGNSLLLILDAPRRFSIDVDIATGQSRESVDAYVKKAVAGSDIFTRAEHRPHKTKPWLPLASYYLHYRSPLSGEEASIMLDVQLRESPYKIQKKKVECGDLYKSDREVTLPVPSSIIGDKLLTIGPKTLGIPLGKGKEAQRLKHVYDVSSLLECDPQIADIRDSFFACMDHENELQETDISSEQYLDDTIDFCNLSALHEHKPEATGELQQLQPSLWEITAGLDTFAGHLFAHGFSWEDLQRAMARVALCLSAVVRDISQDEFAGALKRERAIDTMRLPGHILEHNELARYDWEMASRWAGRNLVHDA